ncbi:hypothetical protein [Streptomyces sp. NPDC006552]|uniref:hypothetical protein n=1 Tax=Streptomyces sp. NPDC006552 TaxID=3157179 RepID=UPI0033B660DE
MSNVKKKPIATPQDTNMPSEPLAELSDITTMDTNMPAPPKDSGATTQDTNMPAPPATGV